MILNVRQNVAAGAVAPQSRALSSQSTIPTLVQIKDMFLAFALTVMAASVVYADAQLQDWIPDALSFPDDTEVVTDRAIGSTVRMFSIATGADVEALFAEWEESLNDDGYPVTQSADDLLNRSIEFSGPGISNAKIIVAPTTVDGRSVVEFDATLN